MNFDASGTEPQLRRIRLTIEYDGTGFVGWQRQDSGRSIQGELERALAQMNAQPTAVRGAGRTDAGVHARGQVAHFDTARNIPLAGFRRGLNTLLPRGIAVTDAAEVPSTFDARFSASGKLYRYQIWNADSRSPLIDRFVWHVRRPLAEEPMREAAARLVGAHDFRAFRAADCERRTTRRTLTRVAVTTEGPLVAIEVEGDAFLKNMVRILAGTLVACGHGQRSLADVDRALSGGNRTDAGVTAPPKGLTLVRVDYDSGKLRHT